MVIKYAARADLHHLAMFLAGRQPDAPQEALQVLDIVLRELPTARYPLANHVLFYCFSGCMGYNFHVFFFCRYSPVGRSFYSTQLGAGLENCSAFYESIQCTQIGISLNIG